MNTKPLLIKSTIGLASTGGIGFAAHQGYQAFQSKSVREEKNNVENKLKKEGYTPVTKDSVNFATILNSYTTISKAKEELKFDKFTGEAISGDSRTPKDILWDYCQSTFDSDASDALFNKAKKWCVEPISVSNILTNKGHTKLNTVSADNGIQKKWDEKIKKHRKQSNDVQKIADLVVGNDGENITEEQRGNIKKKCNDIGEIKSHEDKYEDNLVAFETWCIDN